LEGKALLNEIRWEALSWQEIFSHNLPDEKKNTLDEKRKLCMQMALNWGLY
jgi:hypothetical protein